MEQLGHNGSDDDDGGFAFLLEAFGEGFALLGICFLREARETAVGADRMAGKRGLVGSRLFQRPSPQKQIPSNNNGKKNFPTNFLYARGGKV